MAKVTYTKAGDEAASQTEESEQLLIQPSTGSAIGRRQWDQTMTEPVRFGGLRFGKLSNEEDLRSAHPEGTARFWGMTDHHDDLFSRLRVGDTVVFTGQGQAHTVGELACKVQDSVLGGSLWGVKDGGRVRLIYSLTNVRHIELPYGQVWRLQGFNENDNFMSLRLVQGPAAQALSALVASCSKARRVVISGDSNHMYLADKAVAAVSRGDAIQIVRFGLDGQLTHDFLGREPLASHLDAVLWQLMSRNLNAENGVQGGMGVVHIDGEWGSGKTTLIKLLLRPSIAVESKKRLTADALVVDYDAWKENNVSPEWWSLGAKMADGVSQSRSAAAAAGYYFSSLMARIWRARAVAFTLLFVIALAALVTRTGSPVVAIKGALDVISVLAGAAFVAFQALFWTSPAFAKLNQRNQEGALASVGAEVSRLRRWTGRPYRGAGILESVSASALVTLVGTAFWFGATGFPEWVPDIRWLIFMLINLTLTYFWLFAFRSSSPGRKWNAWAGIGGFILGAGAGELLWFGHGWCVIEVSLVVLAVSLLTHLRVVRGRLARPLLLVVDDLDRCPASRVVGLIETVHTLLRFDPITADDHVSGSIGALGVIVSGEGRWLRRSFDTQFSDFDGLKTSSRSVGSDFLQKVFDHTVYVPALSLSERHSYIRAVVHWMSSTWRGGPVSSAPPSAEELVAVAEANYSTGRSAEAVALVLDSADYIAEFLLKNYDDIMPGNPRLIGRVVNMFAMLAALSDVRGRGRDDNATALAAILSIVCPLSREYMLACPLLTTLEGHSWLDADARRILRISGRAVDEELASVIERVQGVQVALGHGATEVFDKGDVER